MPNDKEFDIQPLTVEEIQSLQVDAAMRRVLENVNHLIGINFALNDALHDMFKAKARVEELKQTKNTLVEVNRGLRVVINER